MKLRLWAAIAIFISSYSPLAVILLIKDLDERTLVPQHPLVAGVLLTVAAVSIPVVFAAVRGVKHGDSVQVLRVANQSGELVNYSIPYMISFFEFDLGEWKALVSFGLFLSLMFVLTIRTQNIFINPVLALVGYGLYDIEFVNTGVTQQATFLSRDALFSSQRVKVRRLSRFLYLVTSAPEATVAKHPSISVRDSSSP